MTCFTGGKTSERVVPTNWGRADVPFGLPRTRAEYSAIFAVGVSVTSLGLGLGLEGGALPAGPLEFRVRVKVLGLGLGVGGKGGLRFGLNSPVAP